MKATTVRIAPVLKHFAAEWTLADQPLAGKAWTLEEKITQAKKGGFQAFASGPSGEVATLCQRHGLEYLCYIGGDPKSCAEQLRAAAKLRPVRVNAQILDHDTPPKIAVVAWIKMLALADQLGLELDLETHRDTCTETPEKIYEIAALYQKATGKKIRFSWDFSHIAVVKHLNPPYAERILIRPELVRLARQVHLRPFNGHHCQVPATNGKGRPSPEIAPYLEFVEAFFACWFQGATGGEVLYACPEFGPIRSGYGLSCFPDVWKDALYLRKKTETIWQSHLSRWKNRADAATARR
jgi:hypothetical protein